MSKYTTPATLKNVAIPTNIDPELSRYLSDFTREVKMAIETGGFASSNALKGVSNSIVDLLWPIGIGIYTQYPAANSNDEDVAFPVSQQPSALFPGTTWEPVFNTEAITFRTEGSPIEDQNDDRTDGLQTDQFQAFQIGATADDAGLRNTWMVAHGRDIAVAKWSAFTGYTGLHLNTTLQGSAKQIKPVSNGVNGDPRMGMETRPRNRLMKIWKRTA